MKFEILNVEHGFCAYAVGRDGRVVLFDCGHSSTMRPASCLLSQGIRSIHHFFVTNYDEDHISDLISVRQQLPIEILTRNASLTSSQIRSLKTAPISPAMEELLAMVDHYTGEVAPDQCDPEGLQVQIFHNDYPTFSDTNNLSLLAFVDVNDVRFALGGDLETEGWTELLKTPGVKDGLRRVDVFVASHHGRQSGYCSEVFDYCKPEVIVMSDGPIRHGTQEMSSVYARHASGVNFNNAGRSEPRKVLTTRKDGHIVWDL